jgi:preprotein translocase subunit SecA
MDLLERIWETTGLVCGEALRGFERSVTSVFGSSNARFLRRLQARVEAINILEPKFAALSNEELKGVTVDFRRRLANGETLDDLLVEAFAACREAGKRYLSMRHFDVQLMGGMVLHSGAIAEMVTGEGKTLVATLPAYLNALAGRGVHVVTVNDYLARRDMEWMGPLYMGLGLTVGAIQSEMPVDERQRAYACDITYGTNNEFGFDYLRDNMRPAARGDDSFPKYYQQSQGPLHFAIIDEVDNILIDEARTPLIISGPAHEDVGKYSEADRIARALVKDEHFEVNEKDHSVNLTDAGVRQAERLAGVESFYTAGNMDWPHLIDNALKAHHLYHLDVNYVVKEGRVVIVDEFTGRLMEGRQWSDGLHQAVEAKEGVKIKEETQTLATITLQNYFKLYEKLCGMTGTAMTEASEFWKIYKLEVIAIPTNKAMQRNEFPDRIYCTEEEKFTAVAKEIERMHRWDVLMMKDGQEHWGKILREDDQQVVLQLRDLQTKQTFEGSAIDRIERQGRPVLVGTTSIEKSERLSALLDRQGIKHQVLNAKHHRREAEIVAQAGRLGAVTIATNMAGRGTDIILGGNPETLAWALLQDKYPTRLDVPREEWDSLVSEIEIRENMAEEARRVRACGGLHVVGTERHEARRIDLQLRGRCGRQGDPGSSRFYLSLRDDLMRIFAGPWVEKILKSLGLPEGEPIESRMVTRRIEAAQKKVEERNFEIRKNLLEYDEVMDEQRKRVYRYRQAVLDGANCKELILQMVRQQVERHLTSFLDREYGLATFVTWAGHRLSTNLDLRDFRGMDFAAAELLAREQAGRAVETQVFDAVEENLPNEEDSVDWNWSALANLVNARWNLKLHDRDLIKVGRPDIAEFLQEKARAQIDKVDLSEGAVYLEEDYGLRSARAWAEQKFDIQLDIEQLKASDPDAVIETVYQMAVQAYAEREATYPVMAGLSMFSSRGPVGEPRLAREPLVEWANQRFSVSLDIEQIKNKRREEIFDELVGYSRKLLQEFNGLRQQAQEQLEKLFGSQDEVAPTQLAAGGNGALHSLTEWLEQQAHVRLPADSLHHLDRKQLERRVTAALEEHYRPEIRRMERAVVLQIVDSSWKDHLLAMDHVKDAIRLVGYAQVDPKVEYKREGMRLFDQMWDSIGQRITELVYRMERMDEQFVGSTWNRARAVHQSAPAATDISQQQQSAIAASQQSEEKIETIRHRGERVGRNDPCPCGSGKKYKSCCMRNRGVA